MIKGYISALALTMVIMGGNVLAVDRDASLYVGVKSCKMCHKTEKSGNQFGKWQEGPHAKAFEVLASPDAKDVAKKLGIDDPQKSGKCLMCHSTAYNWTETVQNAELPVDEGVSCESCHGPGKNYKSMSTMKNKDQAKAAGLLDAKTSCVLCHNDKSSTWKADRYTLKDGSKAGFDFEQAYAKIKHPVPAK